MKTFYEVYVQMPPDGSAVQIRITSVKYGDSVIVSHATVQGAMKKAADWIDDH